MNLRAKTYYEINYDCLRMNVVKKDRTPNKNAFICLIIRYFFPYLKDGKVSLKVDRVFDSDQVSDNTIYVEPDRYSQDDFMSFYAFSKADSYGTALRMLIEKFYTLESDERERIVCSEFYDKLEYAIKKKEEVTVTTYDRYKNKSFQYPFDPYCLARTKDRVFNYLIGKMYRNNGGNVVSLRMSKIVSLAFRNEKYFFTSDETTSICKTGYYDTEILPKNKKRLNKYEEKVFTDTLQKPIIEFSITVELIQTSINGRIICSKKATFFPKEIKDIIYNLNKKKELFILTHIFGLLYVEWKEEKSVIE